MKKIVRILLFTFLLFPAAGHTLTLTQIRSDARIFVKDASSTRQRFTDTQFNTFINQGQRDIVNAVWPIQKTTSFDLVNGTTYYSLPTDIIEIGRVTRQFRNLLEVSLQKLDSDFTNSSWALSGGTPQYYFQDPAQTDKIGFYPFPNSTSSTGTITVHYYAEADTLSSDSDVPFNDEERFTPYHDLLTFYTAYRIFMIEGEVDRASIYRQEYESRLQVMRDRVGSRPNFFPMFGGPSGTRSQ